ncbi:MAG: GldG family protein [Clostridiales bacterium]|nr:GldG family protein [Clostridiales bacterium]
MMNQLKSSFTKRNFKAGAMSVTLMAVAVAVVIFINLLVNALPASFTKLDVTSAKLYKLSKEGEELIASFDEEITIRYLVSDESKDDYVDELLHRAAAANAKIKLVTIDPVLHPEQVTNYTSLGQNSFVVVSGKRERAVNYNDLYQTKYYYEGQEISAETYSQYAAYYQYGMTQTAPQSERSFAGETALASALAYVTTDQVPVVYTLSGHGEIAMDSKLSEYLSNDNVDVKTLQLATADEVPADANAVLVMAPNSDLSESERDRLNAYIQSGGHVIVYTYYNYGVGDHLKELLRTYGMESVDGLVMETDATMYNGMYYSLYPRILNHEFTKELSGKYLFAPIAHGIKETEQVPEHVTVEPLLETSDDSFARVGFGEDDDITSVEKTDADAAGPFMIGASAIYAPEEGEAGRVTWYATPYLTNTLYDDNGAISELFLATVESTCEIETSVSLATKKITAEQVVAATSDRIIWGLILVGAIPLAIFALGLCIWMKRRKK